MSSQSEPKPRGRSPRFVGERLVGSRARDTRAASRASLPLDHQNRVVSDKHPNRRDWLTLAFVCLAIWIQTVDATVVNVALPEIGEDLNATNADLQWVMDAFNVALAGVILLGSGLADRFGRKRICELGILLFAVSSVAAALSTNIQQLLLARVVMGVATALVLPSSFSILTVTFSGAARHRAVATWSATAGLGIALGPVVGGLLLGVFDWPSVFWLNVPAAVLAAIGIGVVARESYSPGTARLDGLGGLLSVVGLGGLVFAIIEGPAQGWTQPAVLVSLVAGVTGLVLFVLWELRAERPMFQVRVLKHPTVAMCGLALLLVSYGCFALFYLVPQYLLYGHGMSVQVVGIAMLPMGLGFAIGSPFCPRLVRRFGVRAVVSNGLMFVGIGLAGLALAAPESYWLNAVLLLVFTAGWTCIVAPSSAAIIEALPEAQAGDASAVNQAARQVGAALGVAVVGSIVTSVYTADLGAVPGVPSSDISVAQRSLPEAVNVAQNLPTGTATQLITAAVDAFYNAVQMSLLVSAIAILAAAALSWVVLRRSGVRT